MHKLYKQSQVFSIDIIENDVKKKHEIIKD